MYGEVELHHFCATSSPNRMMKEWIGVRGKAWLVSRAKGIMISCNTKNRIMKSNSFEVQEKEKGHVHLVPTSLQNQHNHQPPQLGRSNLQFYIIPSLLAFPFANRRYQVLGADNRYESHLVSFRDLSLLLSPETESLARNQALISSGSNSRYKDALSG